MEVVNNRELEKVIGGISVLGFMAIAALIIFISGVFEGFTNPGRCSSE